MMWWVRTPTTDGGSVAMGGDSRDIQCSQNPVRQCG